MNNKGKLTYIKQNELLSAVKFVFISISVLIVILITSITGANFSSLSNAVRLSYNFLPLSYSQQEQDSSAAAINNTVQWTLIVTTKVNNEGGGSSKPSDFITKVHGNNPSISSFPGNSSGTVVKLDMGMYSVT